MAVLAQGFTKLQVQISSAFVDIPGGTNAAGGGKPPNNIDATNFDTPVGTMESLPGPRTNSPYTFEMQLKPSDATQEALFTAEGANNPLIFRLKTGTVGTTFSAVPSLSMSSPVAGLVTYSISLNPLSAGVRGPIS